jgi:anthranilate phosphoribosyltransferase
MEAALALVATGQEHDLASGARRAAEAIDGGAATATLAKWAHLSTGTVFSS